MDKDKETQEWTKDSFVEAVMFATYGDEWPDGDGAKVPAPYEDEV